VREEPMGRDRQEFKKSPEELTEYLMFRRRGSIVPSKKGRGSPYKRNSKHKKREEECNAFC
jgi:hypothetical protein